MSHVRWAQTVGLMTAVLLIALPVKANENGPGSSSAQPRATVKSVPRARIAEISSQIDALIEKQLQANEQQRNPLASDEIFLRRAYLDIVGRIPTLEETRDFRSRKGENKRAELIDELLDSYGYTSRQFNFWADLLRIQSNMPGGLSGLPYIDFVKDSLESNLPYDDFVRELVGSEGANLERGNGAVGYYLRDRNMPEDNMSNTIRIFLGTRLECAQCHDHPFDKWTQRQYFEMVAFTGGMRYQAPNMGKNYQKMRQIFRSEELPEKLRPIVNNLSRSVNYGITGKGTGLARLPENFLGDDGYDGEIVVAKEMFEGKALTSAEVPPEPKKKQAVRRNNNNVQQAAIPGAKEIGSREIYAQWLTSPDNPRFATVIANRLWKQALGVGLIEPVDIIEDSTVASNPELMDYLTATMVELDFDMKQFLRAIYNTRTYQSEGYGQDIADPSEFYFNGPAVRRMSAEQIWDSLLTLTVPDTDQRFVDTDAMARYGLGDPYELYEKMKDAEPEDVVKMAEQMVAARQNRNKRDYKDDPVVKKYNQDRTRLQQELRQARKRSDNEAVRRILTEQAKLTTQFRQQRQAGQYQRASELRSPAPAGHFLREFGQSDREVIANANKEPAVTQVLAMMNGYVEERIARDQSSLLMQYAINSSTAEECIENVFLAMLNREPTSKENRVWERDFLSAYKQRDQEKIKEIFTDLIWTLANSNEFIFVK